MREAHALVVFFAALQFGCGSPPQEDTTVPEPVVTIDDEYRNKHLCDVTGTDELMKLDAISLVRAYCRQEYNYQSFVERIDYLKQQQAYVTERGAKGVEEKYSRAQTHHTIAANRCKELKGNLEKVIEKLDLVVHPANACGTGGAAISEDEYNRRVATQKRASDENRSSFSVNADSSVTDLRTGLTWKRCSVGQDWDGSTCTGNASTFEMQEVEKFAQNIEKAEPKWRLPTTLELRSIVSCSSGSQELYEFDRMSGGCTGSFKTPTIASAFFPNTPNKRYFTSSSSTDGGLGVVTFWNGSSARPTNKTLSGHLRLVSGTATTGPAIAVVAAPLSAPPHLAVSRSNEDRDDRCGNSAQYYQSRYEEQARVEDLVCMQKSLKREMEFK